MRLVAEFLAPGPQPPRRVVQRVLVGEAHRAVHLMRDRGAGAGGLADPHLGDRDLGRARLVADAVPRDRLGGAVGGGAGRRDLAGQLSRDCAAPPGTWRSAGRTGRGRATIAPTGRGCVRARRPSAAPAPRRRTARCRPCRGRRRRAIAAALAPSNETVSRGSPARLGCLADREPRRPATSATDARRRSRRASTAICPALRANGTCRARPRELAVRPARYCRRHGPARSSSARRAPRSRPARAASPPSASRRAAPARRSGRRRATRRTRRAARRRRRRASSGTQVRVRPDSSSASHSACRPRALPRRR